MPVRSVTSGQFLLTSVRPRATPLPEPTDRVGSVPATVTLSSHRPAMEVIRIEIRTPPSAADRTRIVATVRYDTRGLAEEEIWFEVPSDLGPFLSVSGNPWLACLIPLAVTLQEPLHIRAPVDPVLLENVNGLMQQWHAWYRGLRPVPIEAQTAQRTSSSLPGKTAALFSGGVDSYFTVLRNGSGLGADPKVEIDDLLFLGGFDIPTSQPEVLQPRIDVLKLCSRKLGKNLVTMGTNVRRTAFQVTLWGKMSHGCVLAAAALTLESLYRLVLIPATHQYGRLIPWGSHPETDVLFSTSGMTFVHDGAEFDRAVKTRVVADSPVTYGSLRVCFKHEHENNCSACSKCYRTMAALAAIGVLDRYTTFEPRAFSTANLTRVYTGDRNEHIFLAEVRTLAQRSGRLDIARAIDASFRRSFWLRPWIQLCRLLHRVPYCWRWADPLENRLLRGLIV